jgi:hypothetical protein
MIVYSKRISQFIREITYALKTILAYEVGLKVAGERFYNPQRTISYPIRVVIYNHKKMLGYFDPNFYELGFHECLMGASKESLYNVIRHELAHYLTFMEYGGAVDAHGPEFRAFCIARGWNEKVYQATTCLEGGSEIADGEEEIVRKVKKLMALANSANKNEAELAMLKSQQLLLKHHIDTRSLENEEEDKVFLLRILKQKKENAKMRAIGKILETFFVNVVYSRSQGFIHLEILGSATNVEIAKYVASVLHSELDHLWNEAQKLASLKGVIAKNSFFLGLAKGYCDKVQAFKRDYGSAETKALMVIEKKLTEAKAMAYPRLTSTRRSGGYCSTSSALGQQMGRQLNINPAIHRDSSASGALLT